MAKKKASKKKAPAKKKSIAKKKTATKKKAAKKVAKKKVAKKASAKKVTKKAAKKVSKKKVAKKAPKKVSKKAVKKVTKKVTKKAQAKSTKTKKVKLDTKKVPKKAKQEPMVEEIEVKPTKPVNQTEDSKVALKKEVVVKELVAENTVELNPDGLTTRKARLIEKYIRQGKSWADIEKVISEFAVGYNMREEFHSRSVIHHQKMGVGYVMSAGNNRMTVYFREGVKNLIMNYKS